MSLIVYAGCLVRLFTSTSHVHRPVPGSRCRSPVCSEHWAPPDLAGSSGQNFLKPKQNQAQRTAEGLSSPDRAEKTGNIVPRRWCHRQHCKWTPPQGELPMQTHGAWEAPRPKQAGAVPVRGCRPARQETVPSSPLPRKLAGGWGDTTQAPGTHQ